MTVDREATAAERVRMSALKFLGNLRSDWACLRDGELRWRDVLGDWRLRSRCFFRGHDWQANVEHYGSAGTYYDGDICSRCYLWRP